MSEEGVVQVFRPRDGAPALVGVVGPLQLDVLKARLDAEYSLPSNSTSANFRWRAGSRSDDRKKLEAFIAANGSGVADDVDGDPVFLAKNEFYLGYNPRARGGHHLLQRQGREEEGVRGRAAASGFLHLSSSAKAEDPVAAASRLISSASGILGRPVEPA